MADLNELAARVLDATTGAEITAVFDEANELGLELDELPNAVQALRDDRERAAPRRVLADQFDPPAEAAP